MSIEKLRKYKRFREKLEEKNFMNLILFYEPELRRIINGVSPSEVLSFTMRRKFRRIGIFKDKRGTNQLSIKALRILNNITQIN